MEGRNNIPPIEQSIEEENYAPLERKRKGNAPHGPTPKRTKAEREQILKEALEKVNTTEFKTIKDLVAQLSLKYQDLDYDIFRGWLLTYPIGWEIRKKFSPKREKHKYDYKVIIKKAKELAPFVKSFADLVRQLQSEYPNINKSTFKRHLEKIFPETKDKGAKTLLEKLRTESLPQNFNNDENIVEVEQLSEEVEQLFHEGEQPFNPENLLNRPQPFLNLLGVVNNNTQVDKAEVEQLFHEGEQPFNPENLLNRPQPFLNLINDPLNNTLRTGRQHIGVRQASTPQQLPTHYTGNPFSIFAPPSHTDSPSWMDPLASYSPLAHGRQDNRFVYATHRPTHNTQSGLSNYSSVSRQALPSIEQAIDELFQHFLTSNEVAKFLELKNRIMDAIIDTLQNGGYDPKIGPSLLKNSLRQGMQNLTIQQLDQFEQNFRLLDTQHLAKNDLSFRELLHSIFNEINSQRKMVTVRRTTS